jgi:hypothetical protein
MFEVSFPDFSSIRVPQVVPREKEVQVESTRRRKTPGLFIRGPIYLDWLSKVCELPGQKVLAVALALLFQSGLRQNAREVKLTSESLKHFNVSRQAKCEALKALEKAGLIRVKRERGKNPLVTILYD